MKAWIIWFGCTHFRVFTCKDSYNFLCFSLFISTYIGKFYTALSFYFLLEIALWTLSHWWLFCLSWFKIVSHCCLRNSHAETMPDLFLHYMLLLEIYGWQQTQHLEFFWLMWSLFIFYLSKALEFKLTPQVFNFYTPSLKCNFSNLYILIKM